MVVLLVVAALLVGVALGALGGGGSILAVPALVYLAGQAPAAATSGSLLIVGTTTLVAVLPHLRAGRVRLGQGIAFGLLGVGGSALGSRLSVAADPDVLLAAFSALMLVVAAVMIRRRRTAGSGPGTGPGAGPGGSESAVEGPAGRRRGVVVLVVTATAVGLLTGFFGVGGGFAVVPALVLALRLPMPVAVGTSLVVITVNSASALVSRWGQDLDLDWAVLGGFAVLAVAGSLVGARLVGRVRPERLQLAFTVLLVAVAVYTAVRSVPQLV
jgi:uncharacterized membrane protein YfcA